MTPSTVMLSGRCNRKNFALDGGHEFIRQTSQGFIFTI